MSQREDQFHPSVRRQFDRRLPWALCAILGAIVIVLGLALVTDDNNKPVAVPDASSASNPEIAQPPTPPPPPLPPTSDSKPTIDPATKRMDERIDALAAMPDDQCQQTNAYAFLAPGQPEVMPDGSVFYYDCPSDTWGWYIGPVSGHAWTPSPIDQSQVSHGVKGSWLPIELIGAPRNLRHPLHKDAVTLAELSPGTYCVRGLDSGEQRTIGVDSVGVQASFDADTGEFSAYPAVMLVNDNPESTFWAIPNGLEKWGVIPFTFGRWSTAYLTPGACQ